MRKVILLVVLSVLASCGAKERKNAEDYVANPSASADKPADVDQIARGATLVKESDCPTCHHKTNNIIGPAHLAVSEKYEFTEASVKLLAEKIIKGGSGVWGPIPMAAHADIKQDEAEAMARYVLSLDGEKEH